MLNAIRQRLFGTAEEAESQITDAVARVVERVLRENADLVDQELGALKTIRDLRREVEKQEAKLADLKAQQKEKQREIDHKLGLHKQRVDQERELAKEKLEAQAERLERDHSVSVREAKVAAREEAMKEANRLLSEQMERMEGMVDTLVGALPKAEIMANLTNQRQENGD